MKVSFLFFQPSYHSQRGPPIAYVERTQREGARKRLHIAGGQMVRLPPFGLGEVLLKVDLEPWVVDEVPSMRTGMVVNVEHGKEELAQRGRVVRFPPVLLHHDTLEGPMLEVANIA